MLWRLRSFPDFIEPCLPSPVERPPAGADWIHEIKHDGFRLVARRGAERVRLFTRNGNDWSERFPLIVEALNAIKATTCLIDGEAVTCSEAGLADFDGSQKRFGEALETRGLPGSNCDWYRMSVYHASGNMIGWRGRPVAFDALASGVQQNQGEVDDAKCRDLGHEPNTWGYGNCRLELEIARDPIAELISRN